MGGQQQNPIQQQGGMMPPPMPPSIQYFYSHEGKQMGPVTFEQLKGLFAGRTVNKDSLV
jgi:hypothetical protein